MFTNGQLIAVGEGAADAIAKRSEWIHRRVEQISFPLPSERMYRRDISIDLTIPDVPAINSEHPSRFYVPVSLLERWPPILRLDLRSPTGDPIPLLTSDQNAVVDAALLRAVAKRALQGGDLALGPELAETIDRLAGLRKSPRQRRASEEVLGGTLLSLIPPEKFGTRTAEQQALAADRLFVELAGAMPRMTLLWLRVEGQPGDREVVKLSYDAPFNHRIKPWSAQAFGLKPLEVDFEAPHLGGSGSYHLAVSVPAPLLISDAAVLIQELMTAQGLPKATLPVTGCTSSQRSEDYASAEGILTLYARSESRDARFYVSGPRTGSQGKMRISTVVARSGLIRPGAMAGMAITALLALITLRLDASLKDREAVVTTLLIAPALLAYLVVRPADHAVVGQYVAGLRRVLIGLGVLPLAAASALAVAGGWKLDLKLFLAVLTLLSASFMTALFVAWHRASTDSMQPFSSKLK